MYKEIILDAEDQAALRDLNDKTAGVQRMIQMFVESGERRMAQLQQQGRETFGRLAEKYGLDLKHVSYVPSDDGTKLIPIAVNLQGDNRGTN
jgi:hypothetical protein